MGFDTNHQDMGKLTNQSEQLKVRLRVDWLVGGTILPGIVLPGLVLVCTRHVHAFKWMKTCQRWVKKNGFIMNGAKCRSFKILVAITWVGLGWSILISGGNGNGDPLSAWNPSGSRCSLNSDPKVWRWSSTFRSLSPGLYEQTRP